VPVSQCRTTCALSPPFNLDEEGQDELVENFVAAINRCLPS